VKLVKKGIGARRRSFKFGQKSPGSVLVKSSNETFRATDIERTVRITGEGESASAVQTQINVK
jgi:hypothetical protein